MSSLPEQNFIALLLASHKDLARLEIFSKKIAVLMLKIVITDCLTKNICQTSNLMTYVFGDIHGCLSSFDTLLTKISATKSDTVITLGDYVDRGADSRGVIDRLLRLREETNLIALRGNHEIMMVEALQGPPASGFWLLNGGLETLESYRVRKLSQVPQEHWDFFQSLEDYHVIDNFLYTHATPDPSMAIADFDEDSLFWDRFRDLQAREDGNFLICGHTPQETRRPGTTEGHVCLDTGGVHGGYLTALEVETGKYYQANEEGGMRDGQIEIPSSIPNIANRSVLSGKEAVMAR